MKTLINILAVILIPISIISIFISVIIAIIFRQNAAFILITVSLVFIINSIILFVKKNYKLFIIIFSSAAILLLISIFSIVLYNNYEKNLKRVDNYIRLDLYYPFDYIRSDANSKIAKLTNESDLIITNNFPRLDGATALFPLYSSFANAVYKITDTNNMFLEWIPYKNYIVTNDDGKIETVYDVASDSSYDTVYVLCSKTHNAYINLIYDKADLIFCAAPSEDEIEEAEDNNRELILTPIGKEAFIFFVNSENKIDNLSKENLKNIYTGKINNWKEVGGYNMKIKAYQRNANSGSQTAFINFMSSMNAENDIMNPDTSVAVGGMLDIINKVSEYRNRKNALGYSFLFFASDMVKNNEIKILSIDNIKPSRENIQNSSYPLANDFYAVTTKEALNKNHNIKKLIDFILSEQGQYLVEETGYTPIK
ncbi:substrate-binding domain-containing protein [uncultured Brachyspira sp.]|uniref:substrate-binding domain-containing protein n=3 Tax=uncultured Brachyspira sp. TaxID=221953 RepID=UPI002623031A|nr:substrate-binding domain-containing protein [uncultured Brachyspira sp.]